MRLCTFSAGGPARVGVSADGTSVLDVGAAAAQFGLDIPADDGLRGLLEAGAPALDQLRGLLERAEGNDGNGLAHRVEDVTLHHPYRPRKNILRAGENSRTMSGVVKASPPVTRGPGRWQAGSPIRYYTKAPTAVADPGQLITWPASVAQQVYAEAQLAIVIGRVIEYTTPADALAGVAGYAVATDVTSYDLKLKHGQFPKAASLDSFFPWGPFVVTADEVPDPDNLRVSTSLNGNLMHEGSTSDTVLSIGEMLAQISFGITLEPGDVLLLGAAECVGFATDPLRWLAAGDTVSSTIEHVGAITNPAAPY